MADALATAARLRVPLGFLVAPVVFWLASPTVRTLAAGSAVACVGEALRVWAAGHISKSREVTSSGPYRWFAHPLYVGSSIMGIGLAIAANHLVAASCIVLYLGVTIAVAIKSEERHLRQKFGDRYERYRRRRGDGPEDPDSRRRFRFSQVMTNREYRALAGFALAMGILALKLL